MLRERLRILGMGWLETRCAAYARRRADRPATGRPVDYGTAMSGLAAMDGLAAVVLAGGAGRRMGGVDKPALPVGGRPMLTRVLAAVAGAQPRIVVGSAAVPLPPGVCSTLEDPPGGGPVAATSAGLVLVPPGVPLVALLAGDLPLLTAEAVGVLSRVVVADATVDGALYRDGDGRRQLLCGVWRVPALRAAVDRSAPPAGAEDRTAAGTGGGTAAGTGDGAAPDGGRRGHGASMRSLLADLHVVEVDWAGVGPPPWFDCDTDADLRRAEEWAR